MLGPTARRTTETGAAGVFLVAAHLARRGWPVSVTYGNTARTDLLAQVGARLLPAAIQVKTKSENSRDFQLRSLTDPSPPEANEWVVLVALRATEEADYFVIPRDQAVGSVAAVMHDLPGNQRGSLGPQEFAGFKNGWDLMEQPAQEVTWRVEPWVLETLTGMRWSHLPRYLSR